MGGLLSQVYLQAYCANPSERSALLPTLVGASEPAGVFAAGGRWQQRTRGAEAHALAVICKHFFLSAFDC